METDRELNISSYSHQFPFLVPKILHLNQFMFKKGQFKQLGGECLEDLDLEDLEESLLWII